MIAFTELVNSWRDGALSMEADEALQVLIKSCIDTGKAEASVRQEIVEKLAPIGVFSGSIA